MLVKDPLNRDLSDCIGLNETWRRSSRKSDISKKYRNVGHVAITNASALHSEETPCRAASAQRYRITDPCSKRRKLAEYQAWYTIRLKERPSPLGHRPAMPQAVLVLRNAPAQTTGEDAPARRRSFSSSASHHGPNGNQLAQQVLFSPTIPLESRHQRGNVELHEAYEVQLEDPSTPMSAACVKLYPECLFFIVTFLGVV